MADPAKFDRFARTNCGQKHKGKCIDVIYGFRGGKAWTDFLETYGMEGDWEIAAKKSAGEIQALRYPVKTWAESEAKEHCKSRGGSFEAAQKKEDEK